MRSFLVFAFVLIAFIPYVLADARVGEALPTDLSLLDHNCEQQNFDSIAGEKGAVVFFVRSADWCPYCQVQLIDLRDDGAKITDLGYSIVSVSYDDPGVLKAFRDKYKFPYTMLSDAGSETIKAFGILNEEYEPDHFAYGIPHPTVYVVSHDGVVQSVLAEDGHKDRPQIEAIVEAIKR